MPYIRRIGQWSPIGETAMNIQNRSLANEYFSILSDGHATGRLAEIAEATDRAVDAILNEFKRAGLNFPGDDRCANIELAIYAAAKSVNGPSQ